MGVTVNAYGTPCTHADGGLSMLQRSTKSNCLRTERHVETYVRRLQDVGAHLGTRFRGQRTVGTGSSGSSFPIASFGVQRPISVKRGAPQAFCAQPLQPCPAHRSSARDNLPAIQPGVMQLTAVVVGGSKGVGLAVSEHVDRLLSLAAIAYRTRLLCLHIRTLAFFAFASHVGSVHEGLTVGFDRSWSNY